ETSCFPACREGYVCHNAQCISLCNPPCPPEQVCIEGRRCDLPMPMTAGPPIYEPPPPPPPTKQFDSRAHSMLALHLGLSGTEVENGDSQPLDTTLGFSLRRDVPIERYLLLGPLLQFGAWRRDASPTPNRNYYVDVDLFIRGRVPLPTQSTNFQLWA